VDYRLWVRVRVGHIFMSKILFRTVLDKKKKNTFCMIPCNLLDLFTFFQILQGVCKLLSNTAHTHTQTQKPKIRAKV